MLFALAFALTQYLLCLHTEKTTVTVSAEAMQPAVFKLYWADADGGFREMDSAAATLVQGSNRFTLTIPSLAAIGSLRIDPLDGPGKLVIRSMTLTQSFLEPMAIDFQAFLQTEPASQGLADVRYDPQSGLMLHSSENDPWLLLAPGSTIDLQVLALWIVTALVTGASLRVLLASNWLKGDKKAGLLHVEMATGADFLDNRWLGALQEVFPDLQLRRTMTTGNRYIYQFTFTAASRQDPVARIDSLHREYPRLHFHLQMHRSGHVC